jgi:hypothetical protein
MIKLELKEKYLRSDVKSPVLLNKWDVASASVVPAASLPLKLV